MRIIAHRGASAERPENTIAAFARALELEADMIELDVRVSRDGVLHVAHDRVASGPPRGVLRRPLAWAEIRARAGPSASYPPLAEVLDRFAGRIALNLELKERRAAPLLVAELARRRLADGILVSSFDRRTTRAVHALAPGLAIGLLASRRPLRLAAALAEVAARSLHPRRCVTDAALVARAHAAGVAVYVWTVDDPADMRLLASWGVDGIFTNDPAAALRAVGTAPA